MELQKEIWNIKESKYGEMWYLQVNLTEILLIRASFRLVEVYYKNLSIKGYDKRKEKNLGKSNWNKLSFVSFKLFNCILYLNHFYHIKLLLP